MGLGNVRHINFKFRLVKETCKGINESVIGPPIKQIGLVHSPISLIRSAVAQQRRLGADDGKVP